MPYIFPHIASHHHTFEYYCSVILFEQKQHSVQTKFSCNASSNSTASITNMS